MNKSTPLLITVFLFAASLVMSVFAGTVWYQNLYLDEEKTFWATIENSLAAGQYTKEASGDQGGAITVETQVHNFVSDLAVEGKVKTTESGRQDPDSVTATTRAFIDKEYLRYDELKFRDEEVSTRLEDAVNVWAVSDVDSSQGESLLVRSLASSLIMHGNFDSNSRDALMEKLRDGVYTVDFQNGVTTSDESGRPQYTYTVSVDRAKYTNAFVEYARQIGLNELAQQIEDRQANPETAETSSQLATLVVDARSRTLLFTSIGTSQEGFTGYGVDGTIERPEDTIPFAELQTRLNE